MEQTPLKDTDGDGEEELWRMGHPQWKERNKMTSFTDDILYVENSKDYTHTRTHNCSS